MDGVTPALALRPKHKQAPAERALHSGQHLEMNNAKTCQTTDLVQGVLMRASLY